MGDPSGTITMEDMEEEDRNMNEGDQDGAHIDDTGDQGTEDTGCLAQADAARCTADGNSESPSTAAYVDLEELSNIAHLKDMKIAMEYIRALEIASLDDDNN